MNLTLGNVLNLMAEKLGYYDIGSGSDSKSNMKVSASEILFSDIPLIWDLLIKIWLN